MSTFFSQTDQSELHDNTKYHVPFYLSLIVNYAEKYCAKIAFIGNEKPKRISYKGNTPSQKYEFKLDGQDILVHIDCKITFEVEDTTITDSFKDRFKELKKIKEEKAKTIYKTPSIHYNPGRVYPEQGELFPRDFTGGYYEDKKLFKDSKNLGNKQDWHKLTDEVTPTYENVKDFLVKWLSQDFSAISDLKTVYRNILASGKPDQDFLLELVEENLDKYYTNCFNNIPMADLDKFAAVMRFSRNILTKELEDSEWLNELIDLVTGFEVVG